MRVLPLILFLSLCLHCSTPKQGLKTEANPPIEAIILDFENYQQAQYAGLDSSWVDLKETAIQAEINTLEGLQQRLQQLDPTQLSTDQQINRDLLQLIIEDRLFQLHFKTHRFPLNAEGGFLTDILYDIQGRSISNEAALQAFFKKLNTLPDYLAQRQKQMQLGQAEGKSSPQLIVRNCIQLIDLFLATDPAQTFYMTPARNRSELGKMILPIVEQKIFPAYRQFRQFLQEDYLPKAPEAIGISKITEGKAFYEQRVRYFTTLDISPQEVFDIGQQEVKRIRTEMEAIIAQLNFGGSFEEFLAFLRADPQFYAKTGEELLKQAAWITKRMEGQLPKYFGQLPRMPLTVLPVAPSIAPNYTSGRYSPGSYEQHRAGAYLVNTYKLESRPLYALPALSLHEGVPGHHLQIMLAAEIEDVPDFRRRTYLSAYGEGWGLYAEYLGKEAGIYDNLYEEFGRLTYEMWRACRLVVDPGMHYFGWTRQQAFEFMLSNTALSLHEVNTEIDRYIGWPGQAVSYKMGELTIRDLRKEAEQALGQDFDLRAFHDIILENGSVPLNTLKHIIRTELIQAPKQKG